MTDPLYDEPSYLTELPEDLKLKRAAAARRRRWRRRLALAALVAVVGALAALVVTSLGGGDGSQPAREPKATGHPPEADAEAQATQPQDASPDRAAPAYPADWEPHPGPVPVLEYHAIETPTTGEAFPELFVEPQDFEAQMQWLDEQGFEAVTLDQVEEAWYEGGRLPPAPIVISFDDGYPSQYASAFGVLQRLEWPGVLNLLARGSELPDADAQRMLDAGWELASKATMNIDLTTVDSTTLEREVAGSRRILQRRFDVPVNNFCYPLGSFDTTVISAVHRAGYVGAQTEVPGIADAAHPYIIDRIGILLSDGLAGFISKLQSTGALQAG
jgi:peptidoglycan/xylan/chitin deacetylase (PgdA/CDA1 family)